MDSIRKPVTFNRLTSSIDTTLSDAYRKKFTRPLPIEDVSLNNKNIEELRKKRFYENKSTILISSKDRNKILYEKPSNFYIDFPRKFENIINIKLSGCNFPVSANVINESNNTIYWKNFEDVEENITYINGNETKFPIYSATITPGCYSIEELISTFTTTMNQVKRKSTSTYNKFHRFLTSVNGNTGNISFASLDVYPIPNSISTLNSSSDCIVSLTPSQVEGNTELFQPGQVFYLLDATSTSGVDLSYINGRRVVKDVLYDSFGAQTAITFVTDSIFTQDSESVGGASMKIGIPLKFKFLADDYQASIFKNLGFDTRNGSSKNTTTISERLEQTYIINMYINSRIFSTFSPIGLLIKNTLASRTCELTFTSADPSQLSLARFIYISELDDNLPPEYHIYNGVHEIISRNITSTNTMTLTFNLQNEQPENIIFSIPDTPTIKFSLSLANNFLSGITTSNYLGSNVNFYNSSYYPINDRTNGIITTGKILNIVGINQTSSRMTISLNTQTIVQYNETTLDKLVPIVTIGATGSEIPIIISQTFEKYYNDIFKIKTQTNHSYSNTDSDNLQITLEDTSDPSLLNDFNYDGVYTIAYVPSQTEIYLYGTIPGTSIHANGEYGTITNIRTFEGFVFDVESLQLNYNSTQMRVTLTASSFNTIGHSIGIVKGDTVTFIDIGGSGNKNFIVEAVLPDKRSFLIENTTTLFLPTSGTTRLGINVLQCNYNNHGFIQVKEVLKLTSSTFQIKLSSPILPKNLTKIFFNQDSSISYTITDINTTTLLGTPILTIEADGQPGKYYPDEMFNTQNPIFLCLDENIQIYGINFSIANIDSSVFKSNTNFTLRGVVDENNFLFRVSGNCSTAQTSGIITNTEETINDSVIYISSEVNGFGITQTNTHDNKSTSQPYRTPRMDGVENVYLISKEILEKSYFSTYPGILTTHGISIKNILGTFILDQAPGYTTNTFLSNNIIFNPPLKEIPGASFSLLDNEEKEYDGNMIDYNFFLEVTELLEIL